MKRMGLTALSTFAAVAVLAVSASSALASPELGRCVAKAGGNYTANCLKKVSGTGTMEWLKSTATGKNKFTSSSGRAFLETKGGTTIECLKSSATGKYDEDGTTPKSTKGVESVKSLFEECKAVSLAEACHN